MIRYLCYSILARLLGVLPPSLVGNIGYAGGYLFSIGSHRKLKMMEKRLARVLGPHVPQRLIRKKARQALGYWGRHWLELLWVSVHPLIKLYSVVSVENMQYLESAQQLQKGIIVIGPHVGNWEVGGMWYTKETGQQLLALTEDFDNPWVAKAMERFRRAAGFVVAEDEGTPTFRRFLRHLNSHGIVGLLVDRDLKGKGTLVTFFEEQINLPLEGVAKLASLSGAPILPAALYYDTKSRFKLVFLEPIRVSKNQEEPISALVEALEELIRRAPEQWHVFGSIFPSETT